MKIVASIATLFFATSCNIAIAENYPFIIEQLPPHLQHRVSAQASTLQLTTIGSTEDYFVSKLKLWDNSTPIKVCFFGGSNELRKKITNIALEWTKVGGKLPLDFGDIDSPASCGSNFFHIRVGFQYKGYWSTVGTDSVNLAAQYEQSMNLALFDVNPPAEPEFTKTVLHEFGHALGLQHEHQSYKSPCVDEFNWEAIYSYLKGPPNYWSVEQIDHNLKPRPNEGDSAASQFDVDSIMLYSFPKEFYKSGVASECHTDGNSMLSTQDKNAIKTFYPADATSAQNVRSKGLSEFNARVDKLKLTEIEKSIAKLGAAQILNSTSAAIQNNGLYNLNPTIPNVPTANWPIPDNSVLDYYNKYQKEGTLIQQ